MSASDISNPDRSAGPVETVTVITKNGPVRGRKRITCDQTEFVSFQGIPFAKPPVGELRFKAPVPIGDWAEPLDTLQHPPPATAIDYAIKRYDERSSEDCLYLNIYTRHTQPTASRPVMLYIHGGGFMIGSTEERMFTPDFLLRSDIVFVTVAYRLGALGFLSVDDEAVGVPGNAGLKDQSLGMRWVRDNIAAFGGDPQNITLFGGSAGAASVHLHMLSEHSRGLFQRAVLQSGSALSPWVLQPRKDLNGLLARRLGWSGEGGVQGMMGVLRAAAARDIAEAQHLEDTEDKQRGNVFVYVPVIEPYGTDTAECFLPCEPEKLAPMAWGNAIPAMIGCTSYEGLFFYGGWKKNTALFDGDNNFVNSLPRSTDGLSEEKRRQLAEVMVKEYYGDEKPSMANLRTFVDQQSDFYFLHGCVKSIRARVAVPDSAPTYVFRFSFDSPRPEFLAMKMIMCGEPIVGAMHGDELMYLFKVEFVDYNVPSGSAELRVIDQMVNIWTTFAATGDPNSAQLGVRWEAAKGDGGVSDGYKCLDIGEQLQFIELPETQRLGVLDSLERNEGATA